MRFWLCFLAGITRCFPPPDISDSFYNDANAPWQYPPLLKYTLSDPGPYASTHSHASAPDPSEPNPFGAHPSMQRWGSNLGSGSYGTAGYDTDSGQAMQGGLAQFQPPWAAKPAVDTKSEFGDNHDVGLTSMEDKSLCNREPGLTADLICV